MLRYIAAFLVPKSKNVYFVGVICANLLAQFKIQLAKKLQKGIRIVFYYHCLWFCYSCFPQYVSIAYSGVCQFQPAAWV